MLAIFGDETSADVAAAELNSAVLTLPIQGGEGTAPGRSSSMTAACSIKLAFGIRTIHEPMRQFVLNADIPDSLDPFISSSSTG